MITTLRLQTSAILLGGLLAGPVLQTDALAQEGPGQGYAKITTGAYSIVAEVRAKPGKEAELRAVTLLSLTLSGAILPTSSIFFRRAVRPPDTSSFTRYSPTKPTSTLITQCLM